MDTTPLCEASLDQIMEELKRRNACVCLGLFDPKTTKAASFDLRWAGDLAWCTLVAGALIRSIDGHVDSHVSQRRFYSDDGGGDGGGT